MVAKWCLSSLIYDNWGKFNEASLPEIEGFYSHSNMDNITDADYSNAKRDCKDFEKKN